jgi:MoaA/NifB/PqqE/SkfB family radical SAM enzyme
MPQAFPTNALVRLGEITNRTFVLPVLVFFPTSRCNSRCASCDWWKSIGAGELTLDEIRRLAASLPSLGTRLVVFSGGEPLYRPDVLDIAAIFRETGVRLHLLTSGVLLDRRAPAVGRQFARVIVSLDAADPELYRAVRGVDALDRVEEGIRRLRAAAPAVTITARATLHRLNFRALPALIDHAHALALDGISFLAADVSTAAFGRARPGDAAALALSPAEVAEFEALVARTCAEYAEDFASGFVQESPAKLARLPQYYRALLGERPFPPVACNAPWMSAVVEADGAVRPCFFHAPIANVRDHSLDTIVRNHLPAFRRTLDVSRDPVCTRCVCAMKTRWRSAPWS